MQVGDGDAAQTGTTLALHATAAARLTRTPHVSELCWLAPRSSSPGGMSAASAAVMLAVGSGWNARRSVAAAAPGANASPGAARPICMRGNARVHGRGQYGGWLSFSQ